MSKRALFPFSSWLPQAMAAPTPVSALVHSSTLIVRGVILFFKYFVFFVNSVVLFLILYLSVFSILLGGAKGTMEADFKKIIAFSTLRQVSLMVCVGSLNFNVLMFFHMAAHARIKFLLFLVFGRVISAGFGGQDVRRVMFGVLLSRKLFGRVCLFGLVGLFYLSSSVSKEYILRVAFLGLRRAGFYVLFLVANLFTLFYSFLLLGVLNKNSAFIGELIFSEGKES